MPSKLKKAIAAMKDQTSISLAKVGGADSSNLEVAILKATTHDEIPIDERHVTEILRIVSSNKSYAASCARAIGRRIGRTRTWIVAVKSLMLILRVFQDGDPHFPKEILHAMKRGYKILNLHSFRDDSSTSCPWDFAAFVRTFALYLDERLECFVTGKLQRRTSYSQSGNNKGLPRKIEPIVRDMKPSVLLDRIQHWQKLLDRAIATQPTGAARTNQLVMTCLYAIVQETFELYRDISEGLALLLDSFFHLQYKNCVSAYETCVKASRQFKELCSFYDLCKSIGVGRTSEYPCVQEVSEELLDTLQEFLKDSSSFPGTNGRSRHGGSSSSGRPPLSPSSESGSARRSEYGRSQGMSLEDLIEGDSPKRYSDPGHENHRQHEDQNLNANDTSSVQSDPTDNRGLSSAMDLLSLDDPSPPPEFQAHVQDQTSTSEQGWELVLLETTPNNQPSTQTPNHIRHDSIASNNNGFEVDFFSDFTAPTPSASSTSPVPNEYSYNPFLQDTLDVLHSPVEASSRSIPMDQFGGYSNHGDFAPVTNASFSVSGFPPTFQAEFSNTTGNGMDPLSQGGGFPPTFHAQYGNANGNGNGNQHNEIDLFHNLVQGSSLGSNTNIGSFSQHNRNISTSFLEEPNVARPPLTNGNTNSNHQARFPSADVSATSYSDAFDGFGGYNNGIVPPNSMDSSGTNSNTTNAIVPFGQVRNNDLFSSGPKFEAAPTFRATSLDMDEHQQSDIWNENDPFGSFSTTGNFANQQMMSESSDQQNFLQQQQLWLQNQDKIIARHLT